MMIIIIIFNQLQLLSPRRALDILAIEGGLDGVLALAGEGVEDSVFSWLWWVCLCQIIHFNILNWSLINVSIHSTTKRKKEGEGSYFRSSDGNDELVATSVSRDSLNGPCLNGEHVVHCNTLFLLSAYFEPLITVHVTWYINSYLLLLQFQLDCYQHEHRGISR